VVNGLHASSLISVVLLVAAGLIVFSAPNNPKDRGLKA